jgi:putative ABC transport system permease protein
MAALKAPSRAPDGRLLARLPYPVRTVFRRWPGMIGMMLGVGIALGVGMTMLGVNKAALDLFTRDYRISGADLRVITSGGMLVPVLPSDSPGTIKHATSVLSQIRGLPGVSEAVGVITWELEWEHPGQKQRELPADLIAVVGVDGDPSTILDTVVVDTGRWTRRGDELFVGSKLSREKHISLGETLRLSGRDFRVVGIGAVRGFGYQGDSVAYLDRKSLRQRADLSDEVNMIAVDTSNPEQTKQRIAELDSLAAYDVPETIRIADEAQAGDWVTHWIMVLLTLAIAALFVNNMLSTSVAARRLELATLRAIGVPNWILMLTIAGEALLVCAVAWVVGIGVSSVLGWGINTFYARAYGIGSLYAPDPALFLTVFGLALALGVVASLGPAREATRVDPVEVLREA